MIGSIHLAEGLSALGFLGFLVWFSYRAGKNKASIVSSQDHAQEADLMARKAEAMAQAQVNKPQTEDSLLQRLKDGNA